MNWKIKAAVAVVIYGAGMLTGWICWKPTPTKPETYAREVRQQDGSLVAERKPMPANEVKPPHQIPKGASLERTGEVVFQPSAEEKVQTNGESQPAEDESLGATPEFKIDWSLVKTKDDGQRMIFSSPDGKIVHATDVVIEPSGKTGELKWAVGAIVNPIERTYGGFAQRDLGPLMLGAQVMQVRTGTNVLLDSPKRWTGQIYGGWRF